MAGKVSCNNIIIIILHQYHVRLYQPLKRDAIQLRFTALQWQVRDFNFKAADEEKTERVWWAETCNRGFSWDSVEAVSAGGIHWRSRVAACTCLSPTGLIKSNQVESCKCTQLRRNMALNCQSNLLTLTNLWGSGAGWRSVLWMQQLADLRLKFGDQTVSSFAIVSFRLEVIVVGRHLQTKSVYCRFSVSQRRSQRTDLAVQFTLTSFQRRHRLRSIIVTVNHRLGIRTLDADFVKSGEAAVIGTS